MQKIIIIAPVSAISLRTRLYKLSVFLQNSGKFKISFWGWERSEGESQEINLDFKVEKKNILRGGGYGGKMIRFFYLFWMLSVFIRSFFIKKSSVVWALGFESAFPLLLASKIIGFKVYFDDADRFSMLFKFPKLIMSFVEYLEMITSRNVYMHVIPIRERYSFISDKFYILQNFPSKSELSKAEAIFRNNNYIKNKIVVNVNGWLGANRGMEYVLEVCKSDLREISFILAGRLDCDIAKELIKYENVQYLGEISNSEALASYYASDFVLTYYNPISKVNTLAASNKWGDAIMTGTGVLVNTEVISAKFLLDKNIGLGFDSGRIGNFENLLRDILKHFEEVEKCKVAALDYSKNCGYFEDQLYRLFGFGED